VTEPDAGESRPMIMRIVVDLPDPLGPRKPVTVPGRTSKERSSTATTLPNRLESPRASITRSALHGAVSFWCRGEPDPGMPPCVASSQE